MSMFVNEVEAVANGEPPTALGSMFQSAIAARHGVGSEMQKANAAVTANFMRSEIRKLNLSLMTPVKIDGAWSVYISDLLDMGWVSVDFQAMAIIFGTDTWELLLLAPDMMRTVLNDLRRGASGLKMLTPDMVQKLHRIKDLGIVREDEITRLETLARKLIQESASIYSQSGVSANEISEFSLRSTELQEAYVSLERRLQDLKALVEASLDATVSVL